MSPIHKISSRRLKGIAIFAAFAVVMGFNKVRAHEFEDGFVERSVSFLIRDRDLSVEYSVGLNPITMRDHLADWGVELPVSANSGVLPAEVANSRGDDVEADSDQAKQDPKSEFDEIVEQKFREEIGKRLSSKVEVTINGKPAKLQLVSTEISSRHHVNMTVRFEFRLEDTGMVSFVAQDRNFLDQNGGVRYSLKSVGSTMLQSSNVEPVLVRSERIEIGKLKKESREKYTRVIAKLVVAPTSEQNPGVKDTSKSGDKS